MRKVTASAVILTALTGCSQGSIPSNQWSFDPPSESEADGLNAEAGDRLKRDSQAGDRQKVTAGLSEEARPFVAGNLPVSGVMGPAFEQPLIAPRPGSRAAIAGRSGGRQLTGAAIGTPNAAASSLSLRSARPDPVDRVRDYLSASGYPSALTNRVPYSSSVYLSSLPVPEYLPQTGSVTMPAPSLANGLASDAVSSFAGISSAGLSSASIPSAAGISSADVLPSLGVQDVSTAAPFDAGLPAYGDPLAPVAEPAALSDYPMGVLAGEESDLPVLVPADSGDRAAQLPVVQEFSSVASDALPTFDLSASAPAAGDQSLAADSFSALESGVPVADTADSADSIGTVILRNLQHSADAASATAVDTAAAGSGAAAIASTGRGPSFEPVLPATEPVPAVTEVSAEVFAEASTEVPAQSPTLERLIRSMPPREASPLLTSYRDSRSERLPAGFEQPELEALDLGASELEESALEESLEVSDPASPAVGSEFGSDTELRQSEAYSPLLEGLRMSAPLSEVYVPIASSVPAERYTTLVGEALPGRSDRPEATFSKSNLFAKDFLLSKKHLPESKASRLRLVRELVSQQSASTRRQRIVWL